ncbi:unnamed protein product [Angiostrongylus costaricensis]|uniref:Uncharacterized protein n=1 Tax=Angiostrongylus costaricensis TaxID=334426 RepID=A0A0R3PZF5_ANGCS|nr:unnamed protein product [Angiostrongylus costaricensis]
MRQRMSHNSANYRWPDVQRFDALRVGISASTTHTMGGKSSSVVVTPGTFATRNIR